MKMFRMANLLLSIGILAGGQSTAVAAVETLGQLVFTGEITSTTCSVENQGDTLLETKLPTVDITQVLAGGASSKILGLTPFSLTLTGCPTEYKAVIVSFGPCGRESNQNYNNEHFRKCINENPIYSGINYLRLPMLQLLGPSNENILTSPLAGTMPGRSASFPIDSSGQAVLNFKAGYYFHQPVESYSNNWIGDFKATVNMNIDYEK
uniref:fimbrial protein n=1 Tax=Castellaniella defragrans TaxID=75697 RepID=UPI00333EE02C